jgi:hypothetical protein
LDEGRYHGADVSGLSNQTTPFGITLAVKAFFTVHLTGYLPESLGETRNLKNAEKANRQK